MIRNTKYKNNDPKEWNIIWCSLGVYTISVMVSIYNDMYTMDFSIGNLVCNVIFKSLAHVAAICRKPHVID